jgi:glycosyltransferase involved in cell wall biosynthesis
MISVIIPTYKSPEALDLCLRSAIKGQINANEIIVVVDGFYDLNKEVLEKWKDHIEVLNLEENVGLCRGTNLGVSNASNRKILIVNDDNVFPQHWDEHLENEWEEGCVITPNQIEPFPSMFKQIHIKDLGKDPSTFDLEDFWRYNYHVVSGDKKEETGSTLPIFMDKYDYLRVGGWDENYDLGVVADWDFFMKCQMSGLRMVRNYNVHFYHFVSLSTNDTEEKKLKRQQAEINGHNYAKYKWGHYIQHNTETNLKYINL